METSEGGRTGENKQAAAAEAEEQLTTHVQKLHTEKIMLERRLKDLERENDHLQREMEVLYMQVDEQSGMLEKSFVEATDAAVEGFLPAESEEDRKKLRESEEARSAKGESLEERPSPGPAPVVLPIGPLSHPTRPWLLLRLHRDWLSR